jgi:hypothetical protein
MAASAAQPAESSASSWVLSWLGLSVVASAGKASVAKKPSQGVSWRKVSAAARFGDNPLHDGLGMIVFPFLVVAFVLIVIGEMLSTLLSMLFWPSSTKPPAKHATASGEMKMDYFDPDDKDLDWAMLRREYIDRCVPFVLRRARGKPISSVAPPASAVKAAYSKDCIRVAPLGTLEPCPGVDELVAKLFPNTTRAYWPMWFLGRYSQGKSHIDLGPNTYNCYFLRKGVKDIVIGPPEVTKNIPFTPGIDGLYIPDSECEKREYLASLPYYYRVDLGAQEMLVFNNSSCLHHFRNVVDPKDGSHPEALTLRVKKTACADARIWKYAFAPAEGASLLSLQPILPPRRVTHRRKYSPTCTHHLSLSPALSLRYMASPFHAYSTWWRFTNVFVDKLLHEPAEERQAAYI